MQSGWRRTETLRQYLAIELARPVVLNTGMKTTSLDRDLRARIDAFVTELTATVKASALESVNQALGNGGAPARRGPGRPRKNAANGAAAPATGRGRRGKRSSEDVQGMAEQVLAHIKANEGQRLEEISAGLGIPSKELKLPVQKLFAAKSIRTKGAKRGTKYFAR
jgi:hypothetical protein